MRSKKDEMERLKAAIAAECANEFPGSVPVFGEGPFPCPLMVIGEAPGRDETRLGRPFVGKAGSFFFEVFERTVCKRQEAYVSNVLKVWPTLKTKRLRTRKPLKEEQDTFVPFLLEEIRIVEPRVILAVGKTAFFALLPDAEFRPGQWQSFEGRAVMPVYHPSYLLRQQKQLAESVSALEKSLVQVRKRVQSFGAGLQTGQ